VSRGAIHWVGFPPANGHEQAGRRPAVLLQDEAATASLPVVFAVPLTTARAAGRFAGTLTIDPTPENGLREPSVALVFQMRAVDRRRIQDRIGVVSSEVLAGLFGILDEILGRKGPARSAPAGVQDPSE
jgi:mRNA interferase MazF